ncbi:MAG: cell wall hydrolase [Alphaproteobacteria bacterium]|nr:cell wall hydrolase [Alphaproteobacteria bacterium]
MKISVALENLASETSCLAEAMYYEARGQGLPGEKAVAEVVVHRMNHVSYPHSICGVVHQGSRSSCQFSFVCDGTLNRPRTAGAWNRAMRLAAQIIEGSLPLTNITAGAISFHAARLAAPNWRGMVRTVTIGNNVFYRRAGRGTS